jgi:hypothetical protein
MGQNWENRMVRVMICLLLGVGAAVGPALAETTGEAAKPECKKAEINPVTGHVFCIDPLGAAVEPPPDEAKPDCKPEQSRGQWTWAPGCTPVPEG